MATTYLSAKPAFANLRFGDWTKILIGQINRQNYCFVVDEARQVLGFAGWAHATREKAEDWVEGRRALSYADSLSGECLIFNAWAANSTQVHRLLVDEMRKLIRDKETLYFRRHYSDGSTRAVRLTVNHFVDAHIGRRAKLRSHSARAATPLNDLRGRFEDILEGSSLHG